MGPASCCQQQIAIRYFRFGSLYEFTKQKWPTDMGLKCPHNLGSLLSKLSASGPPTPRPGQQFIQS